MSRTYAVTVIATDTTLLTPDYLTTLHEVTGHEYSGGIYAHGTIAVGYHTGTCGGHEVARVRSLWMGVCECNARDCAQCVARQTAALQTNEEAAVSGYKGIFLDSSDPEDMDTYWRDRLSIKPSRMERDWNGWKAPVVTGAEFVRFVNAHKDNDHNGWFVTVTEENGVLTLQDEDETIDPEVWVSTETDEEGRALYDLTGWTFYEFSEEA